MKHYMTLLFLLLSFSIFAQTDKKERTVGLMGPVQDYVMHATIEEAACTLMRTDSTVIGTSTNDNGYRTLRKLYYFRDVPIGKYILKVEKEGYETLYENFEISQIHKKEEYLIKDPVFMKRQRVRTLGDVEVVATKVKFYNKGDTIVYNADAFQLAEGSMLDALVAQLPGVEFKSDGRIYVNGRFVESLMLNGRDFFKGRNTVLLTNLPTYVVKDIKVYEKEGDLSQFMGRDMNDKQFVMDVGLKKQYSIGWLGNIEAGIATHDLYMGRLFAMRNTDYSSVSVFGNINNLNDFSNPQRGSDWTPDKMPYGRLETKKAGVNVNVDDRDNKFKFDATADITKYDNHQISNTYATNFLSTGDTYQRMINDNKIGNFYVNTAENLRLTPKGMSKGPMIRINHSLNYAKQTNNAEGLSATGRESWDGFEDFAKLLSQPVVNDQLRRSLINRQTERMKTESENLRTNLGAETDIKIPYTSDLITIGASGGFFNNNYELFRHKKIDYFANNAVTSDLLDQYGHGDPNNRGYTANAHIHYNWQAFKTGSFWLRYEYNKSYNKQRYDLFNLDELEGRDSEEASFGTLPSVAEYLQTRDINNSFVSQRYADSHRESALFMWSPLKSNQHYLEIRPQVSFITTIDRLKYQRAELDANNRRTTNFLEPEFEVLWWTKDGMKHRTRFYYNMTTQAPSMTNALDFTDDSDPLNTYIYGNKHLKNTHSHRFDLNYTNRKRSMMFTPGMNLHIYQNSTAWAYSYDQQTGRRTWTPTNVNGNWDFSTRLNLSGPVDKKKTVTFTSNTNWQYINSVDMFSSNISLQPEKSIVKTSVLSEFVSTNRRFGKHWIELSGSFDWINSSSERTDFTTINAYNYNYGLNTMWTLPWKFQLETDFRIYSRRGYEDASMNDDNFVWNARLIRPILKGKMVLKLDAFDIFHELKKVERSINSQGRTERYYNSMPQYVLLHAVYRFDVSPKKNLAVR